VPTVRVASERGIGPGDLHDVTVLGEALEPLVMKEFKKPTTASGWWLQEGTLATKSGRLWMSTKPRVDASICKQCGDCANACPPKAMEFTKGSVPRINYRQCIRCYCCTELCPQGAVSVSTPILRQILQERLGFERIESFLLDLMQRK